MKKIVLMLASLLVLFSCEVKLPETTEFAVTSDKVSVKAEGGSVSISVLSDGKIDVSIADGCSWARLSSPSSFVGDGEIEIQVDENPAMKRSTTVSIVYKDGVLSKDVPLTQDGTKAFLEVADDEIRIEATQASSSNEVGLRTNIPSASLKTVVNYTGSQKDWISSIAFTEDKMTFSTPVGFDTPQPAIITISYQDEIAGVLSAEVSVLLSDKDGYFEAGPHTEIKNASAFVAFLSDAAELDADASYTLGADIDLSGVELVPACDFKGVLDGKNHKIMNWAASAPLFSTLTGSVNNLEIDQSCTLAVPLEGDMAFIAGLNKGTVRSCISNGKVQVAEKAVFPASRAIAGLVAVNEGVVTGCTNKGEIKIETEGFYQAALWLGGVVGKTKAASEAETSIRECRNEASVILNVDRCKSPIFVGGVVGGTPADTVATQYVSEGMKQYGIISGCANTGAVDVRFNENTNPMLNANIGGVAGYVQGTLNSCENSGALSFLTPCEGTYATKHTSVGGVAGFVLNSISRCNNSGSIIMKGLYAGGSVGDAGSSYYPGTLLGGVAGMAGPNDGSCVIESCVNSGVLDFEPTVLSNSGAIFYVGGVVGYGKAAIHDCQNTESVTLKSNCKNKYLGGIVGQSSYEVTGCTNSGTVTLDNIVKAHDSETNYSLTSFVGGISAYHAVANVNYKVSLCNNSGEINFLNGPKGATNINEVGGICGRSLGEIHGGTKESRCSNTGNINYLASTRCYLGGICGYSAAKVLWMNNSGSIVATGADRDGITNASMVGGFVGVAAHSIKLKLEDGVEASYGAGTTKAGYTGNQTGNVTVALADGSTGSGAGLVFGKLNASGGAKTAPDGTALNAYCNYHSATVSGALSVTGGTTVKAAILAGAGFGTYNGAPVGIVFGISGNNSTLKAPISVNGVAITADNYKDYLAYGQNANVITTYTDYEN